MIYFDIDEVVRDLCMGAIGISCKDQPTWKTYHADGRHLLEVIDDNLDILINSPVTEYYDTIKNFKYHNFITHQQDNWVVHTINWTTKHFPNCSIKFTKSAEEKLNMVSDGDYLVDDYPYFKKNNKVIMVSRPYNVGAKCWKRVENPSELDFLINLLG